MVQQAGSCCRHVPACHVFLAVRGTQTDVQFHIDRQRTKADSDDNRACQLPPNNMQREICLVAY